MSETNLSTSKTSALQQAGIDTDRHEVLGISLREIRGATLLRVQSVAAPEQLRTVLANCGIELPAQTNQSLGQDPLVLCLRPGEWLLFSEQALPGTFEQELNLALEPADILARTALIDSSDGLAIFRLSGSAAPWLLSKVSSLDFVAGADFGQHAARTRMGQAPVVVSYHLLAGTDHELVFDLLFDRSIAAYLWQLLLTSIPHAQELAVEFGREV